MRIPRPPRAGCGTTIATSSELSFASWLDAAPGYLAAWTAMMVAMMSPSLVPLLARYRRGVAGGTALAAGYFTVWAAAGMAAYALTTVLAFAERWWPAPFANGVALGVAALVQWTPWKSRRLECCREFGRRREPGSTRSTAVRDGLRLGTQCCLCCAGLMTFLVVTGMMRLAVVGLVAALVALERFAPHPRIVARAVGALILVVGALLISTARA